MARGQARVLIWNPMRAGAAIGEYKIVKPNGVNQVVEADAATDQLVGVSGRGDVAAGETVEVAMVGIANVKAGAAVGRGNHVTANADGEAIGTTTANNRIVGTALESAADGDIFPVLLSTGRV